MKFVALAFAVAALALPAGAAAEDQPFGAHVSQCAQMLPPVDPPNIVCSHDGHTHKFETFGEMVRDMLEHHG